VFGFAVHIESSPIPGCRASGSRNNAGRMGLAVLGAGTTLGAWEGAALGAHHHGVLHSPPPPSGTWLSGGAHPQLEVPLRAHLTSCRSN
jgi:hypothetical protein